MVHSEDEKSLCVKKVQNLFVVNMEIALGLKKDEYNLRGQRVEWESLHVET
jgi:hypothetical protein